MWHYTWLEFFTWSTIVAISHHLTHAYSILSDKNTSGTANLIQKITISTSQEKVANTSL